MLCRECGEPLTPQIGPGRRRTRCEACSPKDKRDRRVFAVPDLPAVTGGGRLVAVTRARLEELGRTDTPEGVLALYHAELLDSGCGSQTAVVSREYRASLADATKGVTGASTALDALRAKRVARRGA